MIGIKLSFQPGKHTSGTIIALKYFLFCYNLSNSWWSAQSDQECDWSLTCDPPSHHSGLTNSPNPCPRMTNGRLCSELLSLLYWAMLAANTSGPSREGEEWSQVGEERFQDTNMQTDWGESRIHSKLTFGGYFAHIIPSKARDWWNSPVKGGRDWNRGSRNKSKFSS